jgi:DNA-binding FrmR family transcriptional regulator
MFCNVLVQISNVFGLMNTIIKIIVLDHLKMCLCEGCQHTKNNPEMKEQKVTVL